MSLDQFLGPAIVKPKQVDIGVYVEERCSNAHCRKILGSKEPKYELSIKGIKKPYCRACAKKILGPQEESEENL